jgi:iron-sulfur cluster repair protein YtfE (RIC family)
MGPQSLQAALEGEHRDIDAEIEPIIHTGVITEENRRTLTHAAQELRRHIYAEEELLFPALREAGLVGPILVMLRDHAQMWAALDVLEQQLDTGAGNVELASVCRELFTQLQEHNWKEESVLYPQAEALLDTDALTRLRAFLDNGTLPAGWTCQHLQV